MKTFEQKIMARVRRIYYLKKVVNPLMLKLYGVGVLSIGVVSLVSVRNVFMNMPALTDVGSMYNFTTTALMHTEVTVQFVFGTLIVLAVLIVRDAARNFSHGARHLAVE
ncbi:MAG: hypothetical protein OQJ98_02675 [Candidatus Pacebacteria bacterium]|nr:hypothetical protein [Candidatus Paceibacterota bacterium]